jgi:hypothetical protein
MLTTMEKQAQVESLSPPKLQVMFIFNDIYNLKCRKV